MDDLRVKLRRENMKSEILEYGKMFINKEDNTFNTTEFKNANSYYYTKISYYFGTWADFYEELGVEKKSQQKVKEKLKAAVVKRKTASVRNALASEMFLQLREQGLTYEEIGRRYGVSKQLIYQLGTMLSVDDSLF